MPRTRLQSSESGLLVLDIQTGLAPHIYNIGELIPRISFLVASARALDVPVIFTEQNPDRMGSTLEILEAIDPLAKMSFSAVAHPVIAGRLQNLGRRQWVIAGLETHICVSQTAHDLLELGMEVVVCPDAVSARTVERHKLGMERIRDAGVIPAHTESVVYEWMGSAEHPKFRDVLSIVKRHP